MVSEKVRTPELRPSTARHAQAATNTGVSVNQNGAVRKLMLWDYIGLVHRVQSSIIENRLRFSANSRLRRRRRAVRVH